MDHYRVTEVLYHFTGMKFVKTDILENAAVRGTKVHAACEGVARGLDPWELSPECQGYFDSFMRWWEKGQDVLAVEKRFFSDRLGITGQVDFILDTPRGHLICDLKTSAQESKTWRYQGSAYSYLAREAGYEPVGIMFLKLDRDGKYPREYYYEENMEMFCKVLEVYEEFFATKKQRDKVQAVRKNCA